MSSPQTRIYTIDDIYNLPDGERAELIDGQIYYLAPPSPKHQEIVGELFATIHNYVKRKGGSCKPFVSPFAVFLVKGNTNYVEPDISILCTPDKLTDKGCEGGPDWVIEVVSPGSRTMDYHTKLFKYRTAGVREYWIVDPLKNRTTVWNFERSTTEEYSFTDTVKAGIYEDFSIDFSQLDI